MPLDRAAREALPVAVDARVGAGPSGGSIKPSTSVQAAMPAPMRNIGRNPNVPLTATPSAGPSALANTYDVPNQPMPSLRRSSGRLSIAIAEIAVPNSA